MILALSIIGSVLLLACEGHCCFILLTRTRGERLLSYTLSYPLGVLVNALIFFVLTVARVPLSRWSVLIMHTIVAVVLWVLAHNNVILSPSKDDVMVRRAHHDILNIFSYIAALFLAIIAAASILHAVTIPSFYWDAFTNWAMRSKLSLIAGTLANTDVTQPQYPILIHSLQILPMAIAGTWKDQVTNIMTLLLSLSGFASIFLLLRREHGMTFALVTLAVLLGLPLMVIHLRQSYADIHLVLFVLLSAVLFIIAMRERTTALFLLSAAFAVAAAWTKLEGIYTGVLPWMLLGGIAAYRHVGLLRTIRPAMILLVLLTIPWPLFNLLRALPLSPHGASIAWHPEALPLIWQQLFTFGMFGVAWWVIVAGLLALCIHEGKKLFNDPLLLWSFCILGFFLYAYVFSAEVRGLIQGDNFSRAFLLPTVMFLFAIGRKFASQGR